MASAKRTAASLIAARADRAPSTANSSSTFWSPGAGSSTRARRAPARCHACRQTAGSPHAPRPVEVALEEHAVVAERCIRSRLAASTTASSSSDACLTTRMPRPPAARRRLNDQRIADLGWLASGDDETPFSCATASPKQPRRPQRLQESGRRRPGRRPRPPASEVGAQRTRSRGGSRRRRPPSRRERAPRNGDTKADLDGLVGGAGVQRAAVIGRDHGDGRDPEAGTRGRPAARSRRGSLRGASRSPQHGKRKQARSGQEQVGHGVARYLGERAAARGSERLSRGPGGLISAKA